MKLIGFTYAQLIAARDTCGIVGLHFTSGAYVGNREDREGIATHRKSNGTVSHYTLCLRVRRISTTGPRGGKCTVPSPYARTTGRTKDNGEPRYTSGAVNWQGHFLFMAKLFELNRDGQIRTSLNGPVAYTNEVDFYFKCNAVKAAKAGPRKVIQGGRFAENTLTFGDL